MGELNGKDYRALRRLSTRENETLAAVGQTCERVPVKSLATLLASGKIELVPLKHAPAPLKEKS